MGTVLQQAYDSFIAKLIHRAVYQSVDDYHCERAG